MQKKKKKNTIFKLHTHGPRLTLRSRLGHPRRHRAVYIELEINKKSARRRLADRVSIIADGRSTNALQPGTTARPPRSSDPRSPTPIADKRETRVASRSLGRAFVRNCGCSYEWREMKLPSVNGELSVFS